MNALLITALDYRTPRKANLHFIAEQLAKRGPTRFFSLRYSALSRFTHDPRIVLDARANRIETIDGVDCFLWKSLLHPFNTRRPALRLFEDAWFGQWIRRPPAVLDTWIREADTILFESGSSILFFDRAEALNPTARKVYIASDDLATINVASFVQKTFDRVAPRMTGLCLPSPALAAGLPAGTTNYFVPHGLDASIADRADPSPYSQKGNAVAVGSMLFDRAFFEVAAPLFPQLTFHVIGSGLADKGGLPPNVRVYDEMPHDETLRYIKHADVGIAPYRGDHVPAYLADTSMKLMQYDFFGLPAVCPASVRGDVRSRFGYRAGSAESIAEALRAALAAGRFEARRFLGWDQVADRLADPARFAPTVQGVAS